MRLEKSRLPAVSTATAASIADTTYPTDARHQAMDGPQEQTKGKGTGTGWGGTQLAHAYLRRSMRKGVEMAAVITSREDGECERRNREGWEVMNALKWIVKVSTTQE